MLRFEIQVKTPTPAETVRLPRAEMVLEARPLRILDVDTECRPLSWINQDFVSKELTAIAWAWTSAPDDITCYLLGETDPRQFLAWFLHAFEEADIVTGHWIVGHDLPLINGALMELGLPLLPDTLIHDTKAHLTKRSGISCSQESLSAMLQLEQSKVQMDQAKWRSANRLTPEGLALARARVTGDVRQHIALRQQLLAQGYVGPPARWTSGGGPVETYTP